MVGCWGVRFDRGAVGSVPDWSVGQVGVAHGLCQSVRADRVMGDLACRGPI